MDSLRYLPQLFLSQSPLLVDKVLLPAAKWGCVGLIRSRSLRASGKELTVLRGHLFSLVKVSTSGSQWQLWSADLCLDHQFWIPVTFCIFKVYIFMLRMCWCHAVMIGSGRLAYHWYFQPNDLQSESSDDMYLMCSAVGVGNAREFLLNFRRWVGGGMGKLWEIRSWVTPGRWFIIMNFFSRDHFYIMEVAHAWEWMYDFEMPVLSALCTLIGEDGNVWLCYNLDSLLLMVEGLLDCQLQRLSIRILKLVCLSTRAQAVTCAFLMLYKMAKWDICLPACQFFMWRLLHTWDVSTV